MTSIVDAFRAFGAVLSEPTLLIAADRRIITGNARAIQLFGPTPVQNRALTELLEPVRQDVDEWLELCFGSSHLIPGRFRRADCREQDADIYLEGGALRWEGSTYVLARARHLDQVLHRVLELQEKQARFQAESEHDALTGLLNRGAFEDRLQRLWDEAAANGASVCLMLSDIDHFKRYNDCYGHGAGDECLRRVAQQLARCSGSLGATAARIGGEEFAVFAAGLTDEEAFKLGRRMVDAVAEVAIPHEASFSSSVVTLSTGVATATASEGSLQQLRLTADRALYEAKRKGRNRCERADPE